MKQIFLALLIATSLQLIHIEGVSCAKKIRQFIKQTVLEVRLNKIAQLGIFYIRKITSK